MRNLIYIRCCRTQCAINLCVGAARAAMCYKVAKHCCQKGHLVSPSEVSCRGRTVKDCQLFTFHSPQIVNASQCRQIRKDGLILRDGAKVADLIDHRSLHNAHARQVRCIFRCVVLWVFYRFYGGSLEQLQRPVISRQSLQAPAMG